MANRTDTFRTPRSLNHGLCFLVAAAALVSAPAANAGIVSATTGASGAYGVSEGTVTYAAAPGESNRVTMKLVPGSHGTVEIRDAGAPIQTGERCTLVEPEVAHCEAAADFVIASVNAGDGDDQVTVDDPLYGILYGGPGNDSLSGGCQSVGGTGDDIIVGCRNASPAFGHSLRGGPGADSIQGGDASEVIDGGGGIDMLNGGAGNDDLSDGDTASALDADVIDGGAGSDTVTYATRTGSLHVDLAEPRQPQGEAGEQDTLTGVENVIGGMGSDILLGDAGANRLDGGGGADRIDGRGGNDEILDGAGIDTVSGGPGDDSVLTRDLYRDAVSCGAGRDQVLSDSRDTVRADCESRATTPPRLLAFERLGVKARRASIRLRCEEIDQLPKTVAREFEPCGFNVVLKLRISGKMATAGTTTCSDMFCRPLVLRKPAWKLLLHRRSLPACIDLTRIPKVGALEHVERIVLKLHRGA